MKHKRLALAACAAIFSAGMASAGPGCDGKAHDVTASMSQPAPAPDQTIAEAESHAPSIDLLAFNVQSTAPEIIMLPATDR